MKKLNLSRETLVLLSGPDAIGTVRGGMPGGSGRTLPTDTVDTLDILCKLISAGPYLCTTA